MVMPCFPSKPKIDDSFDHVIAESLALMPKSCTTILAPPQESQQTVYEPKVEPKVEPILSPKKEEAPTSEVPEHHTTITNSVAQAVVKAIKPSSPAILVKPGSKVKSSTIWLPEDRDRYIKLVKRYGNQPEKYVKHFKGKSLQQIKNFWMNHKYKGLCFLHLWERAVRARAKRAVTINQKTKKIFKGPYL